MQSRPNPHDAFSRQAFGSPRHIAGLLKLILPKRLRALLDLDPARIRLHDAAHIDPALRGTASDLIVEVPRREGTSADGTERAPTSLSELIDLPDVPLLFEYIHAPKDRAAAELLLAPQLGGRPFITGPGVPAERLAALRKAFEASLHDPDLLQDAAKRQLEVQFVSGAEISDVITQAFKSPPDIVERVRKIYNP
jgi:hypothetical protein